MLNYEAVILPTNLLLINNYLESESTGKSTYCRLSQSILRKSMSGNSIDSSRFCISWILSAWLSNVNFCFIDFIESRNHRTAWVGRDLKPIQFQPPPPSHHELGCYPSHQAAQSPIQPVLEHFQEWGSYKPCLWGIWFWFLSLMYHTPLTHMHAPLPPPQHAPSLPGEASLHDHSVQSSSSRWIPGPRSLSPDLCFWYSCCHWKQKHVNKWGYTPIKCV